ncbi:MAG TPA: hypothetical protein DDY70_01485, partial [Clostridiales bacterium]|nr:hypothetical protein [Clostridiales bacterium]
NRRSTVAYSATCKDGNVGVNFRFRIEGADTGNLQFELASDAAPRLVFTFDFAEKKALCYTLTDKDAVRSAPVEVEGLTLTAGGFYSVSLYYDKGTTTATISVTDNTTGTAYGAEVVATALTSVSEMTLRLPNRINTGVTLSLDYVEVYTGTFARTFEEKQKKSEAAVINLVNLYNTDTTTDAQKEELIDTLHTLLSAGFTATEGSEAYEALYGGESLGDKIPYQTFAVTFYTKKMIDAVANIDATAAYTDRSTFVDELNRIHDVILAAGVEDPDDDSEYARALAKYHTESAAVEKIRADAELLISTMTGVLPTKLNYAELSALLEAVADTEQDATYPGIADAIAVYDQIEALVSDANQKALTFLTAVTELADTDASFAARYSGYTAAGASYYDDETFFLVEDGETVHPITDALAAYAAWSEYFDNIVSYNESFLSYISRAVYATERSSRIGCLMSAESLMKDEDGNLLVEIEYIRAGVLPADVDFTNSVECAIAKIDEMNRALEADKTAIANYIAAVNRLKSAT